MTALLDPDEESWPDGGFDTDSGSETTQVRDRTVRLDRSARRAGRAEPDAVPAGEPEADDTVLGSRPQRAQTEDADAAAAPAAPRRAAYSPDVEALRSGYAARPAAPVMAERAPLPARMAQPPADGEAVDRSLRGKARRHVAWVGGAVTVTVVVSACLLAIVVASLTG